jgi:hypothetical protein
VRTQLLDGAASWARNLSTMGKDGEAGAAGSSDVVSSGSGASVLLGTLGVDDKAYYAGLGLCEEVSTCRL